MLFDRLEDRTLLATIFTVTNPGDSGAETLRQAIIAANSTSGPDEIRFAIPGNASDVHTISLTSALPPITEGVTIDGYSQPGSAPNRLSSGQGLNAAIRVELDGSGSSSAAGLEFSGGSGSLVQGLAINHFLFGITLRGPSTGTVVSGNFIGTNAAGTAAQPNIIGVALVPNAANLSVTTADNRIEGNLISGNTYEGIIVGAQNTATASILRTTIVGNYIGTDLTGTLALGNGIGGSVSFGVGTNSARDTQIGGDAPGEANVIAFNNGAGVQIGATGSLASTGNSARGNSIHDNEGLGIASNRTFLPTMISATADASSTRIVGRLNDTPNLSITLDFYANNPTEPKGYEGRRYLGSFDVLNNASGDAFFDTGSSLAGTTPGEYITATTTHPGLDTSKFSGEVPTTVNQQQLADVVALVNALPSPSEPVVITVNLAAGTTYEGITASPPPGVTLILNGDGGSVTFEGHSPALTVTSGTVIVTGLTFINSTDASTILVTGGTLQMRDSVVRETTGGNRSALEITGGSVDLGTVADPGGNTLIVEGPGNLIRNSNLLPFTAEGNQFYVGGTLLGPGDLDPTFGDGGLVQTNFLTSQFDFALSVAASIDGSTYTLRESRFDGRAEWFMTRLDASGAPDDQFGDHGSVELLHEFEVIAFHDGKIYLVGSTWNPVTGRDFAVARYLLTGQLDSTFGDGGLVKTDIDDGIGDNDDRAHGVAFQGDKIVVVGETRNESTGLDFAVARYNPDGSLDPTFDTDGLLELDFGTSQDFATAVAIDNDRITVVGNARQVFPFQGGFFALSDFALARINDDGSLDSSFNGTGKLISDLGFSPVETAQTIALLGDRIVVAGTDGSLVRYQANGALDLSFSGDGKLNTGIDAKAVFIDGSHVVVAGDVKLARYDFAGNLDLGFGDAGRIIATFGISSAVELNGQIITGGRLSNDSCFARLSLATGALDPTFGNSGLTIQDVLGPASAASVWEGLVQHMDGEEKTIVLADLNHEFRLLRYNENGTLDTTFGGSNGINLSQWLSGVSSELSVAVQGDKILVSALTGNGLKVARIQADGSRDPAFGNDGILATGISGFSLSYMPPRIAAQGEKLIVAVTPNSTAHASSTDLVVARYTSTGAVDTTFGNQGRIVVDVSGGEWEFVSGLQVDGDVVVVSVDIVDVDEEGFPVANLPSALVRIDSEGVDTQFGTNGMLPIGINGDVGFNKYWAMQGDKTVVATWLYDENDPENEFDDETELSLTMYDGGELDTEFGTAGVATFPFDSPVVEIGFRPDGGITFMQGQSIVRLLPDGRLDSSFGTNGIAPFDGPFGNFALQADGKIVLFPGRYSEVQISRLLDNDDGIDNAVDTQRYAISRPSATAQRPALSSAVAINT